MINKIQVINFLQDFGYVRLDQLQTLYNDKTENFRNVLVGNMVSKKDNILIHNTKKIDKKMIIAINILCKYSKRLSKFYKGYDPVYITFLTKDNTIYHIIIANEENE